MEMTKEERENIAKYLGGLDVFSPEFRYAVGYCYLEGYGIDENHREAFKWIKPVAEAGHPAAQNSLGWLFEYGDGISEDFQEAVKWYACSAEQGNSRAQYNLGFCYKNGEGVEPDYNKAIELFTLADSPDAHEALGDMYYNGEGVEKDLYMAKMYYEKSRIADDKIAKIDAELAEIARAERMAARKGIFISYAHKDMLEIDYIEELHDHLESVKRVKEIKWWDDKQLESGEKWEEKIKSALETAKVAILFVSARFFASNYVWRKELPGILAAAEEEGLTVLWLLVSNCDYEETAIYKYQAVTDPKRPLAKLTAAERDDVYTDLMNRIKKLIKT